MLKRNTTDLIEKLSDELKSKVDKIALDLYGFIDEEFLSNLDAKNGRIVANTNNYTKLQYIDVAYEKFIRTSKSDLLKWLVSNLLEIFGLNAKYYKQFAKSEAVFLSIEKQVIAEQLARIGYDGKAFVKGGLLYDILNGKDPIRAIKAEAIKAIASGQSLAVFKKGLKAQSVKQLDNYFKTNAYDAYAQNDRAVSDAYAQNLGLNYAIYEGSIMGTTRPFCKARAGKLFTRKQIDSWETLQFEGKPNGNYNPATDLGGHNCRHSLSWISDELAEELMK